MINRARSFVTMRMKNRQKLREFKASRKEVMKMRDVIGSKMS
jgi:Mg2+ and Co2+ transporter CorA